MLPPTPSAWPRTSLSTSLAVEHLGVARVGPEQVVGDRAARLRAEPAVDGGVEEADLRLVDDPVGDEASRRVLEHVLRLEVASAPVHLEVRRHRGAQLDEVVIEEWHPHLERVRHRGAIEVVEHVVGEPELAVEEERRRQRRVREVAEPVGDRAQRSVPVELRERAAYELLPHVAGEGAAHREQPLGSSGRSERGDRPAQPAGAVRRDGERSAPERRGNPLPQVRDRGSAMLPVAAEQLVGALAGQRDGDVLRRQLGERDEAQGGEVRDRLVEMPDQAVERDRLLGERKLELVVVCAERVGDEAGVGELVARARLLEPDGEGLHGPVHLLRHQRDDQARVEPAAEHRAERHVAHQPHPHRLLELRDQPLAPLLDAAAALERGLRIAPEPPLLDRAVLDHEDAAGLELLHGGQRCRRRGEEPEREERVDRLVVEVARDEPAREQALELGREDERVAADGVVDRLDPEPVARDHTATANLVPDGDPEHPAQLLREHRPVLLVQVRQDLGVAAARKGVAAAPQVVTNRGVVVELAVLNGPDRAVLVRERLVSPLDVDDAEASRTDRGTRRHVRAVVVRAAVHHRVVHAVENVVRHYLPGLAVDLDHSANATHNLLST